MVHIIAGMWLICGIDHFQYVDDLWCASLPVCGSFVVYIIAVLWLNCGVDHCQYVGVLWCT